MDAETKSAEQSSENGGDNFYVDLARAFGGALIFSVPALMTMEMWSLASSIEPLRLALLILLSLPLLAGISFCGGFDADSEDVQDAILTAFVSCAVGFVTAAVMLGLFGVLGAEMTTAEIVGKIALQTVVTSFGAMLAQNILGGNDGAQELQKHSERYAGQLFLMTVGALFLTVTLASTEEMILVAFQMSEWHVVLLMLVSLLTMHGFLYAVERDGKTSAITPDTPFWSVFLRFTVVGYAIVLIISAYILWTFGRADGAGAIEFVKAVTVIGFPAALGASAARLIL